MAITVLPRDDRDSIINTEDFSRTKHPLTVREVPRHIQDLTGKVFTRLTVLRICSYSPNGARWQCLCECGNEKTLSGSGLRRGKTKSCGCLCKENQSTFKETNTQGKPGELVIITIDGQPKVLGHWLREFGVTRCTYKRRIARGWSIEDALKLPVQVGATDDRNERLKKAKLDREH